MASLSPFPQTSTPVSFSTTWEAIIEALNARSIQEFARLKAAVAAKNPHEVVWSAQALQDIDREILTTHNLITPQQLTSISMGVLIRPGVAQGMSGEGAIFYISYMVDQHLVIAFQKLLMWDRVSDTVSKALNLADDNGGQFFVSWEHREELRRVKENPMVLIRGRLEL